MKAKHYCFLKECDNFNDSFDCILHYSKIHNEALQKIIMHYNALQKRFEELMNENANNAEETRKKPNPFEAIRDILKKRAQPPSQDSLSRSPPTLKTGSQRKKRSGNVFGKENSPVKRPKSRCSSKSSSKESLNNIALSIDPKPSKEKRTKQTKLPFVTTSSAKKGGTGRTDMIDDDDDMTFCEELEKRKANGDRGFDTSEIFNFEKTDDREKRQKELKENESTPKKPVTPVKIKQEIEAKSSKKPIPPPSPDLFQSDFSNSNSVICLESSEKDVYTVSDPTYNQINDLVKEIEEESKIDTKRKRLFEDSITAPFENNKKKDSLANKIEELSEHREVYKDECMDCMIFYDSIVQKKSVVDANKALNNCPIQCDGWNERRDKFEAESSTRPRKKGVVVLKCNSKFARRRKEDKNNCTAPGFWDLNVEPRKSKPLFNKNSRNNNNLNSNDCETPDL